MNSKPFSSALRSHEVLPHNKTAPSSSSQASHNSSHIFRSEGRKEEVIHPHNDSIGPKGANVRKESTRKRENEGDNDEEEEEEEESEFEKQLMERIRLLQNELRRCMAVEEQHEKEKQTLLSSLEKEKETSSSLRAANESLTQSLSTLQTQLKEREESLEHSQKENTLLKNKLKKLRRDQQDDMSVSRSGGGSEGKGSEKQEREVSELKNELAEMKKEREAMLHFMFTPDDDEEEGFIPPFEHRVERVGWMLKESEIMKEWRRRLFVMRGKGFQICLLLSFFFAVFFLTNKIYVFVMREKGRREKERTCISHLLSLRCVDVVHVI